MTLENALIAGLMAVTGALTWAVQLLWREMMDWKATCILLRKRVEELERHNGIKEGELTAYENCPQKRCPFRYDDDPGE